MGAKRSETTQDHKREQPLQAVLLGDCFEDSFRPLDAPKMLHPLCNVKMIDYAIDFLAGAGVEELFVVCTSDDMEEYLENHHVGKQSHSHAYASMEITIIKDTSLGNTGDALRELDRRDLIQSDPFILMFGDIVTNVNVQEVIQQHRIRHKKDRSAIMTCLFKAVGNNTLDGSNYATIKAHTDDLIVGIDPTQENRIVVYEDHCTQKNVRVPCSLFALHPDIQLRCDLLDTGIYICSPDVIARFTDEFDYNDIRRKFINHSVAEEEEGLQNRIFAHIVKEKEYAARVTDFFTYATISKDILKRWCYPIVPENLPSGYETEYRYALQKHYTYLEIKHSKSRVGRSSEITGPGMIGSSCIIGENCRIQASIIGHQCHIDSNVEVRESFLFDCALVETGASIAYSIIGEGAVIKTGAKINRGCVIGAGCVVGEGVVLPEYTRITIKAEEEDEFDDGFSSDDDEDSSRDTDRDSKKLESSAIASEKNILGTDGKGRVWHAPKYQEDENDDLFGLSTDEVLRSQCVGFDPSAMYATRREMQEEADDYFSDDDSVGGMDYPSAYDDVAIDFVPGESSIQASATIVGRQKGVDVIKELKTICMEFETSCPIENLAIELNSFKFSQNASYSDCTMAATLSILERMHVSKGSTDGKLVSEFKGLLDVWSPLLQKMSIGVDEEKAIIAAVERYAEEECELGRLLCSGLLFRFLLQTLHDQDIISDEAVLSWAEERKSEPENSPRGKLFRLKAVQDFLEWIENESDESDSDDDESDSDSE